MKKPRKQRATTSAHIDPSKPAAFIINDRFGGLSHFCNLTGYATSTGFGWLSKGYIPAERKGIKGESVHTHIMDTAAAHHISIQPADFVVRPAGA